MRRFLVTSDLGHPIDDVDSADEARRIAEDEQGIAFVRVDPWALKAVHYMLEKHGAAMEAAAMRRVWREQRHAENPRCDFCGHKMALAKATIDHRVPLCEGGADEPDNWLLSCVTCNQRKGRMSVDEFFRQIVTAPAFRELYGGQPAVA
jgi:5-methylcytosine-specific restriction endonuclease McrA